MTDTPNVISTRVDFETLPGGELAYKRSQYLPDEWLSELRNARNTPSTTISTPDGDFVHAISLPAVLDDQWGMEFVMNAPIAEIQKRLKQAALDVFITNDRVV